MPEQIIYEQPLTERVRLFMRYEQLMQRYQSTACCAQTNETHAAILSLIELFSLTARIDLKADIIREIERIIVNLEKLGRYSSVNQEKRCSLINLLREQMSRLHAINGPLGGHLKDHELFNMLRQRSSVPGGINAFDLPQYHHWLNELETERQELLTEWIMPFEKIHHPISLLLTMIRESSNMKSAVAASGYYQQLLDSAHPHLMLRISLPANSTLYPEISSGKHRFNIRFLEISNLAIKAQQTADDIQFQLSCCSL